MTDWKKMAAAVDPPIPEKDVDKSLPVLEGLEKGFRPLLKTIPGGADIWTGPEESE